MSKLEQLKAILEIEETDEDTLLTTLLSFSKNAILNKMYPFDHTKDEIPARYESMQIELASHLYHKMGAEGQIEHTEGIIKRVYEDSDVARGLVKRIPSFVKVI